MCLSAASGFSAAAELFVTSGGADLHDIETFFCGLIFIKLRKAVTGRVDDTDGGRAPDEVEVWNIGVRRNRKH